MSLRVRSALQFPYFATSSQDDFASGACRTSRLGHYSSTTIFRRCGPCDRHPLDEGLAFVRTTPGARQLVGNNLTERSHRDAVPVRCAFVHDWIERHRERDVRSGLGGPHIQLTGDR
jgi:hypothetical protein